MNDVKELKSIELSSFTTMMTGIAVLFSIISAIILSIFISVTAPNGIFLAVYIIPTLIVGAFMCSIYSNFSQGLFYNLFARKLKTVAVEIKDGKEIVKVSTSETATMVALILTIEAVLVYLVSVLILPIFLTSMVQTLIYTGQSGIAYSIYQFSALLSQPATVLIFLFGTFIITFVFVLLGTYIYNIMANSGRGIILNLSSENGLTVIDSVDPLKLAVMFAVICGILSLITGIISVISGANIVSLIGNVLGGFIGGFVEFFLMGFFYNFLAQKIGKIKIELIDLKIN